MTARAARPSPAVEVAGISKRYGGRPVVDDLSLTVDPGEIVALLGPNGAGKTTTVEIIEGYRAPDGGAVRVLGGDPRRASRDHRARVGLMLQGGGGIDPRLTPREVISLYAAFHQDSLGTDAVLAMVGLDERAATTRYRRLSGGERQRVGLALALVGRPQVAILDEPAAGMDVEARAATRDLLGHLRDEGVAILLTSHDLVDVERIADRISIIDRGRLVASGSPAEILEVSGSALRFRVATPLTDADRTALAAALAVAGGAAPVTVDVDPSGWYRVDGLPASPVAVARLASWCETRGALVTELRSGGASLEERYLELIGQAAQTRAAPDDRASA